MKKINKILALAMPLAMLSSFPVTSAYASDSEHELYLSADGAEDTETGKIFCLERSMFNDEDYTLKINIFFRDDVLNAWYVSPKVKCADSHIKLINLVDPKDPPIEFAYAEKDENGELTYGINSTIASGSEKYNTVNFTCMNANIMKRSAMLPYGEFTDSYPLTFFDAVIDKDIPTGEYEIYFLREAEDDPDQRVTEVSLMIGGGPEACDVTLTDMKILVGTLGDIDDNGTIDSIDASAILKEYSLTSTQKEPTFSNVQKKFADTDGNGIVDSSDASLVLKYYAYTSTNGKISMPEYIKTLENKNEQSGENSAENPDEDDDPESEPEIIPEPDSGTEATPYVNTDGYNVIAQGDLPGGADTIVEGIVYGDGWYNFYCYADSDQDGLENSLKYIRTRISSGINCVVNASDEDAIKTSRYIIEITNRLEGYDLENGNRVPFSAHYPDENDDPEPNPETEATPYVNTDGYNVIAQGNLPGGADTIVEGTVMEDGWCNFYFYVEYDENGVRNIRCRSSSGFHSDTFSYILEVTNWLEGYDTENGNIIPFSAHYN